MLPSKSTILLFEAVILLFLHSSGWLMAIADGNEQFDSITPSHLPSSTDGQGELPNAGDYLKFWLISDFFEYGQAEYNKCRWNAIQYSDGNFRFSAFFIVYNLSETAVVVETIRSGNEESDLEMALICLPNQRNETFGDALVLVTPEVPRNEKAENASLNNECIRYRSEDPSMGLLRFLLN